MSIDVYALNVGMFLDDERKKGGRNIRNFEFRQVLIGAANLLDHPDLGRCYKTFTDVFTVKSYTTLGPGANVIKNLGP